MSDSDSDRPGVRNFLRDLPAPSSEESVELLANLTAGRVERIVSWGQVSAPGFWYEQVEDEWVLLLQGGAWLGFDDGREALRLTPGDCVMIPAGLRHRVEWTSHDPAAIWVAVFWRPLPPVAPV